MRHILSFNYTTLKRFCQALAVLSLLVASTIAPSVSAASTNNFYFKDATFDYYLEKTDSGSKLHVKEVLTAIFPQADQNHGITRAIPFSNLDGKNITVKSADALNLTVLRNGETEPVSKIDKDEDEYIIYIGSANSYVHGEQVYTLEYDFYNVISEFTAGGVNVTGNQSNDVAFQELYWDTNGTGWSQRFEKLTANLHLPSDIAKNLTTGTSCYVGYYGISGKDRCTITSDDETTYSPAAGQSTTTIDTGIKASETILTFETENLHAGENLTFVVDFNAGTFSVPELTKNYGLFIIFGVVTLFCGLLLFFVIRYYAKHGALKRAYYKGLFTAPQYQPEKSYNVAEAAELCLSKTENSYVATLLELATSGKISIVKGEPTKILKKDTWSINLNNTNGLTDSQTDLLKILNGGKSFTGEKTIEIKKHTATSTLASLSRQYFSDARDKLKKLKLFEEKTTSSSKKSSASTLGTVIAVLVFIFVGTQMFTSFVLLLTESFNFLGYGVLVGAEILPIIIFTEIVLTIVALSITLPTNAKYNKYTEAGLDSANYLEGLKLYIKMAEADRIKFLQSKKGADVSEKGIVKLYEKLLPYAALFGLEDSWMEEFNRYCKEINYDPDWYSGDEFLTAYVLSDITRNVRSTVASSTAYSNSSSGSSSFS
ncbi:DUF2207 domain-containing protein, partial [Candidatus Saccharibacteria bacterium]|nr:DUF2207 domain-containing protein [Candidatus Saccharibacteria bacterium]